MGCEECVGRSPHILRVTLPRPRLQRWAGEEVKICDQRLLAHTKVLGFLILFSFCEQ